MLPDVIDLFLPLCELVSDRRTLLQPVLAAHPALQIDIVYEGSPRVFITHLLATLAIDHQALDTLLNEAQNNLGIDQAQKLDALREALHTWAANGADVSLFGVKTVKPRPAPFMVEALPVDFVPRPMEFESIVASLVDAAQNSVGITTALKGAGGYGKTTLARAVCHDARIRQKFPDGILWTTLGEKASEVDLIGKVLDLVEILTDKRPHVVTLEAAKNELKEAISNRLLLLVVDDVWQQGHALPFLNLGPHVTTLITTRNTGTLPPQTNAYKVDAMQTPEAVQLLSAGLNDPSPYLASLKWLAELLGEWPLLLKLVNRQLIDLQEMGLDDALLLVYELLNAQGFVAFDNPNDSESRNRAAAASLEVSLGRLEPSQKEMFVQLAIFPEDANIPFTTLEKLWAITRLQVITLCQRLNSLSLLAQFDLKENIIRLHDVVRTYLRETHRVELHSWQAEFIKALKDLHSLPDAYTWRNIAYHLREADQLDQLRSLLLDLNFLQAKLKATDTNALIADCEQLSQIAIIRVVKSALSLSSHMLMKDPDQLPSQLYARLLSSGKASPEIADLLERCATASEPLLLPLYQTLQAAGGALLRTIMAHTMTVTSVALVGEIAVSASEDHSLKVWNWQTGELLRTLNGHTRGVTSVALVGEIAVSASWDHSLKVWNWQTGALLRTLTGHTQGVTGVTLEGEIAVSASEDHSLKVWNWQTGELLHTLAGHTNIVNSVALAGEIVVSASRDHSLKVWNWQTGELLHTLAGHTKWVTSVALVDEIAVSASVDNTLKVWNWQTGELLRTLVGHTNVLNSVVLVGKIAVSASNDNTLKVWNWQTGELLCTLAGHIRGVTSVALEGEIAVSASDDRTLKVWNWQPGDWLGTLVGHMGVVKSVALADVIAVSASWDRTLKVWNWQTGELLRTLAGHTNWVNNVALAGDIAVSGSTDKMLKVWNWQTGELLHTLNGHNDRVNSVALAGDIAVSASRDRTLKVWNWQTGELLRTLNGHSRGMNSVALAGDIAVSASNDNSLKVWNWQTGELLCTLAGHTNIVNSVALVGDIAVSASDDETLMVWNWRDGTLLCTLAGHTSSVNSVALAGEIAVSASKDTTLMVWNWRNGTLLTTFWTDAPQETVAMVSDASIIIAGGDDGHVHFLHPNKALQRLMCSSDISSPLP